MMIVVELTSVTMMKLMRMSATGSLMEMMMINIDDLQQGP